MFNHPISQLEVLKDRVSLIHPSIHLSIHPFSLIQFKSQICAGAYASCYRTRGQADPKQITSLLQG